MTRISYAWLLAIPSILSITACNKGEAEVLEANYKRTTEVYGTSSQKCQEEQRIAAAWARQGNQERHDEWKLSADVVCLLAKSGG